MNKTLISISLLVAASFVSIAAFAKTGNITKTATASQIFILSTGTGVPSATSFGLVSGNFPPGDITPTKTLTSIDYTVAAYTGALSDAVQVCYYRPYTATASLCETVTSGSGSTLKVFNRFTFGNGANIRIIHTITGTPGSVLKPSRQESITYNYSY